MKKGIYMISGKYFDLGGNFYFLYTFAATTHDQSVFSFYPDTRFCNGFEEVLRRYREIVPQLRLSGAHSTAIYSCYFHLKKTNQFIE